MTKSATSSLDWTVPSSLDIDFRGGQLTSDGGLTWVADADAHLGLCAALAAVIPEWRTRRGRHDRETLLRQRILQIAAGYEDQNDATTLRHDPLLKVLCGRPPDPAGDLASQPTFSRLENAISRRTCYQLALVMGDIYLQERERAGTPIHVVLDLDGTDDPVHGGQEGEGYHGYYRQHQFFPLLIFDGDTNHLITAILRPGTVHASRGVVPVLKRIVARLRARWPGVTIEIRADSGFTVPALTAWCEAHDVGYTLGFAKNARLLALTETIRTEADTQFAATGEHLRLFDAVMYQADTWPVARRVIVKAERMTQGPNTRFVVTTRDDDPAAVYAWYTKRGEAENWIKDLKSGCFADRLSCHRFLANQFRLLLHAAAYWLLDTVRRWLVAMQVARMTLETLRLRLLKIGGWVSHLHDRLRLRLATSHPGEAWWHLLAHRPGTRFPHVQEAS